MSAVSADAARERDLRPLLALALPLADRAPLTLRLDRDLLGHGDHQHVINRSAQRSIPTGAVALLLGDLSRHEPGVMHRSPPLGGERPRLLAAVDW